MKSVYTKLAMMAFLFMFSSSLILNSPVWAQPEDPDDLVDLTLPIQLDDEDIDWEMAFFPFDGASVQRIENPDKSGINETDYVIEYIKDGEFWAGFFMHLEEGEIEITDESVATMKVWSPKADIDALLKLEMQDADVDTGDMFAEITEAEEWIELKWDLGDVDPNTPWDLITIIMQLEEGAGGDGGPDFTWYIDDINIEEEVANSSIADSEVPDGYNLKQNYPNPFNPTTQIEFSLPEQSHVTLSVYNILGQQVEMLVNETYSQGNHTVEFDATNLPSGNYIYRLEAGDFVQSQQMMLVK